MTRQERRVFEFIRDALAAGICPSRTEINAATLVSTAAIHKGILRLEAKGYLRRTGVGKNYGLEILRALEPCASIVAAANFAMDGVKAIPLSCGAIALVDADDYEWLSRYSWHLSKRARGHAYAARARRDAEGEPGNGDVYMHRQIMGARPGQQVDHVNHDALDNRRANLRFCTPSQNTINRLQPPAKTGFRGVGFSNGRPDRWAARIKVNRKQTYLGTFGCPVEAARAYDRAALEIHGEFAVLNFPDEVRP